MAVEARHLNVLPPQILCGRELGLNGIEGIGNEFGTQMGYGVVAPLSGSTVATELVVPVFGSTIAGALPVKTEAMKSDSVLPNVLISKKRSREPINSPLSPFPSAVQSQSMNHRCGSFTFLGEDISFQIQQQQLEIDRLITQHTEKVRSEIEDRRKRYSRRIAAVAEENIMKKLKAKEEEIEKIGKLNWALEERVKSLCVENQIWRDLARTNEATANALRCNLEQVLAQVQDEQLQQQQQQQQQPHTTDERDLIDDAQSCCGSNAEEIDRRRLAESASTEGRDRDYTQTNEACIAPGNSSRRNAMCRSCEKEESCVLLLPCRHLCLCTVCVSTLHTCPVCNSTKTASVHVNLSS